MLELYKSHFNGPGVYTFKFEADDGEVKSISLPVDENGYFEYGDDRPPSWFRAIARIAPKKTH